MRILLLLILCGCTTTNPCNMQHMSKADLERQLINGCGK